MNIRVFFYLFLLVALAGCEKQDPPKPDPVFELFIHNEYSELNARFAAFISDQTSGEVLAFRWIPGEDTVHLQAPGTKSGDRFDCTILKVTTLVAPGTGVRDTLLQLTTYTNQGSGEQINLRDQVFQRASTLKFNLVGINSLDSIVVPDAYAILRPQADNNYTGEYLCYHTGRCWFRVKINGEPFWRFVRYDNIQTDLVEGNEVNPTLFLPLFGAPLKLGLPFFSAWDYRADGIVDTAKLEFFPLSPQLLVPGSLISTLQTTDVFEPVNNDQFASNRPYNGFRIQARGTEPVLGGYTYYIDQFFSAMPANLPAPDFDLSPTILSDKRLIAVQCQGDFDLLAYSRVRNGYGVHFNINWEVLTKPAAGILSYRLPDVPAALAAQYPYLGAYDFNSGVKARAESYVQPVGYEEIVRARMRADDPLWQARAGYMGKEETF